MRRALLFAFLAGAAVWTKQQAVFLGAVPFLYIALIGRWRLFRKPAVWVSAGVFLVLVTALTALSLPVHGAGVNQALPPEGHNHVFVRNLLFYIRNYPFVVGPAGMILLVTFLAALAGRLMERRATALYVAWAVSSLGLLLFLGPFSPRYLFFLLPPMIVLGYAALSAMGNRLPRWRRPVLAASALALTAMVVFASQGKVAYMYGPDETARALATFMPHRILYCGGTDGSFIFSYRSHHSPMETVIVAGDKLPPTVFTSAGVEDFARRYGIEYIVLEHAPNLRPRLKHPWEALIGAPPSSFQPLRDIPLSSSDPRWNGFLRIYRFTNPGPTPDDGLTMRMNMVGGSMRFSLGR